MSAKMEQLYNERLKRYTTAMRNEKPDMVPMRPFVAQLDLPLDLPSPAKRT